MQQLVDRWNVFRPYYINSDCRNSERAFNCSSNVFVSRVTRFHLSLMYYVAGRERKGLTLRKNLWRSWNAVKLAFPKLIYFWYLINAGFRKKEKNCRGALGLNSIFNMWATWARWRGLAWPSGTFASMTAPPEKILPTIFWKCVIDFLASKIIFLGFLSMVFQWYYHSCKVERFLIVSENQTKVIKTVSQKKRNTFKSRWELTVKTTKLPKARETRVAKSWLV